MLHFGGQTRAGRWNFLAEMDLGSPWMPLSIGADETKFVKISM